MYNPKAGGMARFQAGVPPPVRVWHLADLPVVSALRAVVGENLLAHCLLGPVQAGLSGIGDHSSCKACRRHKFAEVLLVVGMWEGVPPQGANVLRLRWHG